MAPVSPTAFFSFSSLALSLAQSADPSTNRFVLSATSLLAILLLRARSLLRSLSSSPVQITAPSAADASLGFLGLFLWASNPLESSTSPNVIHYGIKSCLVVFVALTLCGLYLEADDDAGREDKQCLRAVTEKSPLLPRREMSIGQSSTVDAPIRIDIHNTLLWITLLLTAFIAFSTSSILTWILGASPAMLPLIPAALSITLSLSSITLSRPISAFFSELTLLTSFHAVLSYTIQVSNAPTCGVWDPLSRPDLKDVVPALCMIAKVLYYASWTTVVMLFYKISKDHLDTISGPDPILSSKKTDADVEVALFGI
ncbi:hypothetical protein [Phaffia rhodozyma]|uniref:Uncharacterized protein n=1 Tax=Phaffia rhodozyma TaxID=264483 RepID=A0A0F7SWY9_PHARH|nr:hypothetical protein [Phaffia rhodozyma]